MQILPELKTTTLADSVEDILLEYMQKSKINPGDMLPKEEELALHLKVSRHVVREGISRLKALGLVESRKKRGMIMKRPSAFRGLRKLAEANLFSLKDQEELMEMRVAMELGMADFIFARKTPEKIAYLRTVAEEPAPIPQRLDAEIDFHTTLMDFAENQTAKEFRGILANIFTPLVYRKYKEYKGWNALDWGTPTHHEICNVLETGNAEDFYQIMRKHFLPYLSITNGNNKAFSIKNSCME